MSLKADHHGVSPHRSRNSRDSRVALEDTRVWLSHLTDFNSRRESLPLRQPGLSLGQLLGCALFVVLLSWLVFSVGYLISPPTDHGVPPEAVPYWPDVIILSLELPAICSLALVILWVRDRQKEDSSPPGRTKKTSYPNNISDEL